MLRRLALPTLALGSIVVTLGLVELALRLTDVDFRPMKVEDRREDQAPSLYDDDRPEHVFGSDFFVYDPVLIWRPQAGRSVFNRQGFRGAELQHEKSPGALRVATVGDSNTLGWHGTTGAHWPGDLEQLLRAVDDRHRVVNAGVWGYSSHQGIERLREVLALRPDIVTISFGANDAHPVAVPDRVYSSRTTAPSASRRLLGRLRLGRLLLGALSVVGTTSQDGTTTQRVVLDDYRDNLRLMIELTRQAEAEPVLLTRPYIDSVPHPPRWKSLAPRYNAATVEIGAEAGVLVIDFYSLFKSRTELFADESHFTAKGHRLAAEALFERLLPYLAAAD